MQRTRLALCRWLSASAFMAALVFSNSLRAEIEATAPIDDSISSVGQYYAILCNTCSTSTDFINKAVTQYPRVRESAAHVYNLSSGQVRTIALNWDTETARQTGGYEVPVDTRLRTYVSAAGELYRRNGNSLSFTTVIRGDGSVYLKLLNGGTVELRAGSTRTNPSLVNTPSAANGVTGSVTPGRGTPIDLRGYTFSPYFHNVYPNYPRTSYDLAFGDQPGSIDSFVQDYFSTLGQGPFSGVFDPDAMSGVGGAVKVGEQVAGQVSVYLPMQDGGYARVRYDTVTGDVTLRQVVDPSGLILPNGYGNALQFFGNRSWNLGYNAPWAAEAFEDWAARNHINLENFTNALSGYRVTCVSRSVSEVTCTIYPN